MLFATRLRCIKSCLLLIRNHTRFQTTGTSMNRLEQVQKHTDSLPLSVTTHTHTRTQVHRSRSKRRSCCQSTRSSRSSLYLSCHHTKMKRSQRPRAHCSSCFRRDNSPMRTSPLLLPPNEKQVSKLSAFLAQEPGIDRVLEKKRTIFLHVSTEETYSLDIDRIHISASSQKKQRKL